MILQIDVRCLLRMQEFACYYMDILFFTNKYTNISLGFPFINDFYERCEERGFIKNNFIQDPAAIFGALGFHVLYLGHIKKEYVCRRDEFEILHFVRETKDEDVHHFVCGDGANNVTYDSYGVSRTVAQGYLKNKRVFKRIG